MIIRSVIDNRHCKTAKSHINRSLMLISSLHTGNCLHIIGRAHYNHSRNRTHQSDILVTLMACSILTNGDTGMGCTDFYIQMRVSYRVTNLLKGTSCCKHCKGACERNKSCGSKSCCNTDHVRFCDTTVNMSVRICLFKHTGLGSCCQICI